MKLADKDFTKLQITILRSTRRP